MVWRWFCVSLCAVLLGPLAFSGEAQLDLPTRLPADVCVYAKADYALVDNFMRSNLVRRILEDSRVRPAIAPIF